VSARPKLHAGNVVVRLGGALIVDGAALDLRAGELTVLIGPNGAGKTTLMRALAGLDAADSSPAARESFLEEKAVAAAYFQQSIAPGTEFPCEVEVFAVGAFQVRQFGSIGKCALAVELFQCGGVGDRI
jgi:ABC-type Mn2+/Zn2+ transport system ATPase subunit